MNRLKDRTEAGRLLASRLARYRDDPNAIVMALPRGGVAVGAEIARELRLPLDVCVVRKLGLPWAPEVAMGAAAIGGVTVLHEREIARLGIGAADVEAVLRRELAELDRREKAYRGDRPFPSLAGKTAIVADDGIATGATAEAAIRAIRQAGAARVVLAVGVAATDSAISMAREADEVVAIVRPDNLDAVSVWFEDFRQTTDAEVRTLLARHGDILPRREKS